MKAIPENTTQIPITLLILLKRKRCRCFIKYCNFLGKKEFEFFWCKVWVLLLFTMMDKIKNLKKCKGQTAIHFFNAENVHPSEIHYSFTEVYGMITMNVSSIRHWIQNSNERRDNVHDEEPSGHSSLIASNLKKCVNDFIREDQCIKLYEMSKQFSKIPQSFLVK